ncbi:hypothetical protein V6N13_030909 [Hibiscus sabdariffa]
MAPTSSGSISSLAIPLLPTSSQWVSPRCLPNSWLVARFFGRRSLEVIDPGVIRFFLRSCEVSGNRNSYPSIKVSAGSGWWLEGQGDPKLPSEAIHFFSSPPLRLAFPTRPPPKYILAFLFSAFWLCFWYQCCQKHKPRLKKLIPFADKSYREKRRKKRWWFEFHEAAAPMKTEQCIRFQSIYCYNSWLRASLPPYQRLLYFEL